MPNHLQLSEDIHAENVAAGWWTNLQTGEKADRNIGEMLCLKHSEVSEAWESWSTESNDDKLPQYPGWQVELADTAIRLYDLLGAFQVDFNAIELSEEAVSPMMEINLLNLHLHLSRAMEAIRKGRKPKFFSELVITVRLLWSIADHPNFTFDLGLIIFDKRAFNRQREDHKIENRVKEDGKQF